MCILTLALGCAACRGFGPWLVMVAMLTPRAEGLVRRLQVSQSSWRVVKSCSSVSRCWNGLWPTSRPIAAEGHRLSVTMAQLVLAATRPVATRELRGGVAGDSGGSKGSVVLAPGLVWILLVDPQLGTVGLWAPLLLVPVSA